MGRAGCGWGGVCFLDDPSGLAAVFLLRLCLGTHLLLIVIKDLEYLGGSETLTCWEIVQPHRGNLSCLNCLGLYLFLILFCHLPPHSANPSQSGETSPTTQRSLTTHSPALCTCLPAPTDFPGPVSPPSNIPSQFVNLTFPE